MSFKHRKRSREEKLKKAEPRILGQLVMMKAEAESVIAEGQQDPERLKCARFVLERAETFIANIRAHGLRPNEVTFSDEEVTYICTHFPPTIKH